MVKVININRTIKDDLRNIKRWRRMDNDDFTNKIYVSLECKYEEINEKFNIEGSKLELEYVISGDFISYSNVSSIYNVDIDSLLDLAKDNGYKIIRFSKDFDFAKDLVALARKLHSLDYKLIPLDSELFILTSEKLQFNFGGKKYVTEEPDEVLF